MRNVLDSLQNIVLEIKSIEIGEGFQILNFLETIIMQLQYIIDFGSEVSVLIIEAYFKVFLVHLKPLLFFLFN